MIGSRFLLLRPYVSPLTRFVLMSLSPGSASEVKWFSKVLWGCELIWVL